MIAINQSLISKIAREDDRVPTKLEAMLGSSPPGPTLPKSAPTTSPVADAGSSDDDAVHDEGSKQSSKSKTITADKSASEKAAAKGGSDGGQKSGKDAADGQKQQQQQQHPEDTKLVKFDVSQSLGGTPFCKEPIEPLVKFDGPSTLGRELESSGRHNLLRSGDSRVSGTDPFAKSAADKEMKLKIFTHIGKPPVVITARGSSTVDEVLAATIESAAAMGRMLFFDANAYELRMLDDDDGTPDEDMPPIDRAREIHEFGLDAFALVQRQDLSVVPRTCQSVSLEANKLNLVRTGGHASPTSFVKVQTDNETFVLRVEPGAAIRDLIPLVEKKMAKKRPVGSEHNAVADAAAAARDFKFVYANKDGLIEMGMRVADLSSDSLKMVRRVPLPQGVGSNLLLEPSRVSNFLFTEETACAYSEYSVVKTNARGRKQKRVMGIDRNFIYNKHIQVKGTRRKSVDVTNPARPIASIHSCELRAKAQCFTISFMEKNGKLQARDYETETRMECAEIVAKLNFLISLHKQQQHESHAGK